MDFFLSMSRCKGSGTRLVRLYVGVTAIWAIFKVKYKIELLVP